jgi:hypothetical protein
MQHRLTVLPDASVCPSPPATSRHALRPTAEAGYHIGGQVVGATDQPVVMVPVVGAAQVRRDAIFLLIEEAIP